MYLKAVSCFLSVKRRYMPVLNRPKVRIVPRPSRDWGRLSSAIASKTPCSSSLLNREASRPSKMETLAEAPSVLELRLAFCAPDLFL